MFKKAFTSSSGCLFLFSLFISLSINPTLKGVKTMPAKNQKKTEEQEATKTQEQTEEVKKTEETLVLRARKPLKENEFQLLSDLVKEEQEKTGMKIVLIPHSSEVVEDGEE